MKIVETLLLTRFFFLLSITFQGTTRQNLMLAMEERRGQENLAKKKEEAENMLQ